MTLYDDLERSRVQTGSSSIGAFLMSESTQRSKPVVTDRQSLVTWLETATAEQVMGFCAEMARVAPQSLDCFRILAITLHRNVTRV